MGTEAKPRRVRMQQEDRRVQLLEIAASIVLRDGFSGLSIDRVAREAGVARTVVYSQFGTLDALQLELAHRTEERIRAQVGSVVPALDGDPDTLLAASIRAALVAAAEEPDTWRLALFAAETAPPAIKTEIAASRDRVRELLRPALAWGLERRGTPDIDSELFTRTVVAAVEGAIRLMLDDPQTYPVQRLLDYIDAMARQLARG